MDENKIREACLVLPMGEAYALTTSEGQLLILRTYNGYAGLVKLKKSWDHIEALMRAGYPQESRGHIVVSRQRYYYCFYFTELDFISITTRMQNIAKVWDY